MSVSRFRLIASIVTFLAIAILIYAYRDQIHSAILELRNLNVWLVLLQLPLHVAALLAIGHVYYSYLKNAGKLGKMTLKDAYAIAFELHFVNNALPSGGLSGFPYLHLRMRPMDISSATSTLAQGLRFGLVFTSFLVFLGLGLLILAIDGRANDLVMLLSGSIFFIIVGGALFLAYLIGSKQRIKEFVAWLPKVINKIVYVLHYKSPKETINLSKVERTLEELHYNYKDLSRDWSILKQPFAWAFVANIFEIASLYLVFLAFGEAVNPGAVVLAYALANFAGLIAIVPAGVGLYEYLMIGSLRVAGVVESIAISGTLVYRVLKTFLFLLPSAVFFHLAIHKKPWLRRRGGPDQQDPAGNDASMDEEG